MSTDADPGGAVRQMLDLVLQGTVVPFVGAGISAKATAPGAQLKPTVCYLKGLLTGRGTGHRSSCESKKGGLSVRHAVALRRVRTRKPTSGARVVNVTKKLRHSVSHGAPSRKLRPHRSSPGNGADQNEGLAQLAERFLWEQTSKEKYAKLCEALHIAEFADLEPLPVHYALACFALEGLIEEIISTNWDCCVEKAVQELSPSQDRDSSADGPVWPIY